MIIVRDYSFLRSLKYSYLIALLLGLFAISANAQDIEVGAEQTGKYLPLLYGKNVAIVANQTSMIGNQHLVDFVKSKGVTIQKVFSPEHGFRGKSSAGETIKDGKDLTTSLPIVSLYGKNKKPTKEQLQDVDVVVFDIQDVGARFYTYISTMTYVMEACAENGVEMIILDRPNPNGHYVDGPILQPKFKSFVGMHPIPVVHGMTIGEYAQMVNGEGWLANGVKCNINIIKCKGYTHNTRYSLPVKPSPNLPNDAAIALYPSLCFFEGTTVSIGRGTDKPFQVVGAPFFAKTNYSFVPKENEGAKNPKYEGETCNGFDLSQIGKVYASETVGLNIFWLLDAYSKAPNKSNFFTSYFKLLAGTDELQKQVEQGFTEEEIRKSWQVGLVKFKEIRSKYLLYKDFS